MPLLYVQTPTVYDLDPHVFLVRDLTDATLQTSGSQNLDLVAIRKGTCIVDCWVDVLVVLGAAGLLTLRTRRGDTSAVATVLSVPDPDSVAGLTRGPGTGTGYDSIAADGFLNVAKTGAGTTLVLSVYAMLLRPNMTP